MPLPPALMMAVTFASVTFLPFLSVSRLNSPFSPGPIFFQCYPDHGRPSIRVKYVFTLGCVPPFF